jgi:hypothetical protein
LQFQIYIFNITFMVNKLHYVNVVFRLLWGKILLFFHHKIPLTGKQIVIVVSFIPTHIDYCTKHGAPQSSILAPFIYINTHFYWHVRHRPVVSALFFTNDVSKLIIITVNSEYNPNIKLLNVFKQALVNANNSIYSYYLYT